VQKTKKLGSFESIFQQLPTDCFAGQEAQLVQNDNPASTVEYFSKFALYLILIVKKRS
jgi:hypothetical protein